MFAWLTRLLSPPPRQMRSGGQWDNSNTPGSVGYSAPAQPDNMPVVAQRYPYENTFIARPNPEPYLQSAASKDPNRLHAYQDTLQPEVGWRNQGRNGLTNQRDNVWDAGNPATLRKPDQASQRYFNERIPLPEFTTPAAYAHSVYTNLFPMKQGWQQTFVPEPGMRWVEVGTAPPTLLSRPLNVVTHVGAEQVSSKRMPLSGAKSPKRKRSGG